MKPILGRLFETTFPQFSLIPEPRFPTRPKFVTCRYIGGKWPPYPAGELFSVWSVYVWHLIYLNVNLLYWLGTGSKTTPQRLVDYCCRVLIIAAPKLLVRYYCIHFSHISHLVQSAKEGEWPSTWWDKSTFLRRMEFVSSVKQWSAWKFWTYTCSREKPGDTSWPEHDWQWGETQTSSVVQIITEWLTKYLTWI